ncbi:MAG: ABC transporter ATP-binding protein [Thermomicrobiales bacterium]
MTFAVEADAPSTLPLQLQPQMLPAIEVRNVSKAWGGLKAVDNCSLQIEPGKVTGLVGPNGAGKTTLLNLISGFERVDSGEILVNGRRTSHLGPRGVFRQGLVRTFQVPRPIPTMTVLENLVLAADHQLGESLWNTWLRPGKVEEQENAIIDRALWVLEYVELSHLRDAYASTLSGGQKKLLEFARTLMEQPSVILLDEPAAGVNRTLMRKLSERIEDQRDRYGVTFLIIEHDMEIVNRLCDPVIVMSQGSPMFQGTFQAMVRDEAVLEAYLGSQHR